MTKRQVIVRYTLCALAATAVAVGIDAALIALHHIWLPWLTDIAFGSALVLITLGCFAPNAPIFGRVVDGTGVFADVVAITFDDGPSAETTPRILQALRDANMRATFFVLGKHAERHPELVERIVRDGHEVASHGYSHGILVFASRGTITHELLQTQKLLERSGAAPVRLFRTPHGFRNPFVVRVAHRLGYRVVGWTKGVFDTARPGPDVIVRRSLDALKPGAILLLHDADGSGDGDRSQTAEALPAILAGVRDAGLEPVTVSELAALAPERRTSWKRLGLVVGGVAVIVTLIVQSIDRQQIDSAWDTVRTLSLPLVVAAVVANLVSVFFKAVVWRQCLESIPDHPPFRYRQIIPAIFIGFLLNSALVARLGEVGRMYVLRRRVQKDSGVTIPMSTMAGTVVMEQVVLGVTLVMMVVAMILVLPNVPGKVIDGVLALTGAVVALIVGVVLVEVFSRYRHRRRPLAPVDAPAARTWQVFLRNAEALVHEMSHGQQLLRDPARAAWSAAGGLVSWAAQVLGIWLTLRAFGVSQHALGAAAVVFVASNVVGLVQVTPGNVGVFQVAVALALSATYGIDQTTGVTFGIVLQVIEVALAAGLGLVFLSLEGLSFGEVRRGMSIAADEAGDAITLPRPAPTRAERRKVVA
jgi:peptidoglycan-N-acetylglucosamine deacetylase